MNYSFFPKAHVKSVFHIDYARLYEKGFRGLIYDIDATLVPHGKDSTKKVEALFRKLHEMGFQTVLLSNNDEERIRRFIRNIDTLYVCDANKPDPSGYRKALSLMNLSPQEAVVIGDQLFTDILGANRAGIAGILVDYIPQEGETKLGKRRTVEKILMKASGKYHRNRL